MTHRWMLVLTQIRFPINKRFFRASLLLTLRTSLCWWKQAQSSSIGWHALMCFDLWLNHAQSIRKLQIAWLESFRPIIKLHFHSIILSTEDLRLTARYSKVSTCAGCFNYEVYQGLKTISTEHLQIDSSLKSTSDFLAYFAVCGSSVHCIIAR